MSGRHEKGVNVQVLLRCRPFSDEELRSNAPQVVTCNDFQREVAVSQNIAGKQIDRVFTFDKVFGPSAQQRDLYDQAVVPIVHEVLEGFNCTIFAYGQTGTGKTYTMEGECRRAKSGVNGELPQAAGVIPRAVKQIFDTLEGQNAEYSVKVTFLELYNEEITDLLAPEELSKVTLEEKQKKQLPLMEDGKGGVLVRGLEEEIVTSAGEIFTLLERGSSKRRTAETLLNKQSSRSHSLFTITIHIKESTPEGEELIKCGKLNLVDLAGSENISRSGAREGRAREAGEINKSLLTLGRVITALVEHLGHVPYRDSKLTRLLRDSLGGRTKTCIIATVSPAVHCLEETLSTLDYAHRAKHIRNKPEVNQKMMKTTLIKDLYGEIERLKGEVYAAREKNGVYIPKERYYQEESERKAMADQIEQMGVTMETHQKQFEELQEKYDIQVRHCSELSSKLSATERNLLETSKSLSNTEEDLKKCRYALNERDFVISEQKKAENALTQQACVLRSDLEKALKDNASLFEKIGREDNLQSENRTLVNSFQTDLSQQISCLRSIVANSMSQQGEHLQCVSRLCHSFLETHDKAVTDMKKKLTNTRALYTSHIEAFQNVVSLHKASSIAGLEDISTLTSSDAQSIEDYLATEGVQATSIFDDLRGALSTHQAEMAIFASELHQRFSSSGEQTKQISDYTDEFFGKLMDQSKTIQNHVTQADNTQMSNIADFQKAYEEQTKADAEQLVANISNLVSHHILRQKELVRTRLDGFKEAAAESRTFLDGQVSSLENVTTEAKRKWQEFCVQAESEAKDGADYSTAKHSRMEMLLQESVSNAESAFKHYKKTNESVNEMCTKHVKSLGSLVRDSSHSIEQHVAEIDSAKTAAEQEVAMNNEDVLRHVDDMSAKEHDSVSGIVTAVEAHTKTLELIMEVKTSLSPSLIMLKVVAFCFVAITIIGVEGSHQIYRELQSVPATKIEQVHRTGYHFQPPKHWINGPMYFNGYYHLFYQYNPKGAVWGNIVWAHSVSKDLINWEALEPAIEATKPFDIKGCWSGSATILPGNKPVIFYTGIDKDERQLQDYAVPKNESDPYLREWVKPDKGNPFIVPDPSVNASAFRDPTTAWFTKGMWNTIIGSKHDLLGIAYLYKSKDFKKWTKAEHPLHQKEGTGMWECPDFYPVSTTGEKGLDTSVVGKDVKHVFKVSLDLTRFEYYTIGTYDEKNDTYIPDEGSVDNWAGIRYDYGNFYASKTFFDYKKNRRILWGWANESDNPDCDVKKGWAGIQLIPRKVWLEKSGKQLLQWPVEELNELRSSKPVQIESKNLKKGKQVKVKGVTAAQADVEVTFSFEGLKEAEPFDPKWDELPAQDVCKLKGSTVEGGLGPFGLLTLASEKLEEYTPVMFRVFKKGEKHIDHSVVESFAEGGKTVISSRVYPTLAVMDKAHLFLFNNGTEEIKVDMLSAWDMKKPVMNVPLDKAVAQKSQQSEL
ncbi:Kinesin-like protein KIN-5C [Linum grandiflorum]